MAKKSKPTKPSKGKGGSITSTAIGVGKSLLGLDGKGGKRSRRSKGPNYWANKVLVAKLKKKYYRLKYGGM